MDNGTITDRITKLLQQPYEDPTGGMLQGYLGAMDMDHDPKLAPYISSMENGYVQFDGLIASIHSAGCLVDERLEELVPILANKQIPPQSLLKAAIAALQGMANDAAGSVDPEKHKSAEALEDELKRDVIVHLYTIAVERYPVSAALQRLMGIEVKSMTEEELLGQRPDYVPEDVYRALLEKGSRIPQYSRNLNEMEKMAREKFKEELEETLSPYLERMKIEAADYKARADVIEKHHNDVSSEREHWLAAVQLLQNIAKIIGYDLSASSGRGEGRS